MYFDLDFPSRLQIQTHNICNYGCQMCPYPSLEGAQPRKFMHDDLIDKILHELQCRSEPTALCWMLQNEPLLDKRILNLVAKAAGSEGVSSVAIVTNGSAVTEHLLNKLIAFPKLDLTISVNAVDRKKYEEVHGRDYFDRVATVLRAWRGDRSRVRLSAVLTKSESVQARAFRTFASELGYLDRINPLSNRAGFGSPTLESGLDSEFGHCSLPLQTMSVLATGEVILCCHDWSHEHTYGNLRMQSIAEVWNSPDLMEVRRKSVEGSIRDFKQCANCDTPKRTAERHQFVNQLFGISPSSGLCRTKAVIPHAAIGRRNGTDEQFPIVVTHIDSKKGRIQFSSTSKFSIAESVFVQIPVAQGPDGIGFDRLYPIWVQGKILVSQGSDILHYIASVDEAEPGFKYLRWYLADWSQ